MSFAAQRSMFGNLKRETRHPQTLRHRPIHIRGASIFLCAAPPFLISHFSFKRNFQTQSKDSMPTSQGNTDPIIARSDQHSPSPDRKRRCEITIISFSRSICCGELAALIGVTGNPYPSCLSCHSHPIRPCGAPSPRGEGCDTRISSSKKGGEAAT